MAFIDALRRGVRAVWRAGGAMFDGVTVFREKLRMEAALDAAV